MVQAFWQTLENGKNSQNLGPVKGLYSNLNQIFRVRLTNKKNYLSLDTPCSSKYDKIEQLTTAKIGLLTFVKKIIIQSWEFQICYICLNKQISEINIIILNIFCTVFAISLY